MQPKPATAHGWIACDKPLEFGCVKAARIVKRLFNQKRVGHVGTLDPLATGVLTLALGEATKLIPYLDHHKKTYEFGIHWGEARDTDDAAGRVTATSSVTPSERDIRDALPHFMGDIKQIPPLYSAIHINGVRAYHLARRNENMTMPERTVCIKELHYLENNAFRVTCGTGTYVRSLARDISQFLGTVGHVAWLRRTSDGLFSTQHDLWPCDYNVPPRLYQPDELIQYLAKAHIETEWNQKFRQGMPVPTDIVYNDWVAVYCENILQGIATWHDESIQPHRILHI